MTPPHDSLTQRIQNFSVGLNTVYVSGADGTIIAVDSSTGAQRWRVPVASWLATPNLAMAYIVLPPVENDATVYLVGLHDRSSIIGLNRDTGREDLHIDLTEEYGIPKSIPSVHDGYISFGSTEAALFTIELDSNRKHWKFQGNYGYYGESVLRHDKLIIIATRYGIVYALDVVSKRKRWQFGESGSGRAGRPVATGQLVVYSHNRGITALDINNGKIRWSFEGDNVSSDSCADDRHAYVCVTDVDGTSGLLALHAQNGEKAWQLTFHVESSLSDISSQGGRPMAYPPSASGDTVSVKLDDGTVVAADCTTGEERWRGNYPTGTDWDFTTKVLSVGDTVYCVGPIDTLWALDALSGENRWQFKMTEFTPSAP